MHVTGIWTLLSWVTIHETSHTSIEKSLLLLNFKINQQKVNFTFLKTLAFRIFIYTSYTQGKKICRFQTRKQVQAIKKSIFKIKKKWVYSQITLLKNKKKVINFMWGSGKMDRMRNIWQVSPQFLKHLLLNAHMFYFKLPCLLDAIKENNVTTDGDPERRFCSLLWKDAEIYVRYRGMYTDKD